MQHTSQIQNEKVNAVMFMVLNYYAVCTGFGALGHAHGMASQTIPYHTVGYQATVAGAPDCRGPILVANSATIGSSYLHHTR